MKILANTIDKQHPKHPRHPMQEIIFQVHH